MAFTDIINPVTPFIPSSLVLNTEEKLPETMGWVDRQYGFKTKNPTGLLEIRWYCAYEGMSGLALEDVDPNQFRPVVSIIRPEMPDDVDQEAFYHELTRVQTDPCPVFRFSADYPKN